MIPVIPKLKLILALCCALQLLLSLSVHAEKPVIVRQWNLWWTWTATRDDPVMTLMREHPEIEVKEWSSIRLPGVSGRAPLMMGIAGNNGPDAYAAWFSTLRNDVDQGFAYPLNEWIGYDEDGDGQISDSEAKWSGWKDISPLLRQVATVNGKIYGVPVSTRYHSGIVYRIDMVKSAGLNPMEPPRTWDEFLYWCQRLTYPEKSIPGAPVQRGQRGFVIMSYGFQWLPWMNSAGGSPVVQYRESPTTGKKYAFPMEATAFHAPDSGEDLYGVTPEWKADFASEAGQKAVAFYHRLRWQKWIRDPETGEPVNLTDSQAESGRVLVGERTIEFTPQDVITGAVRYSTNQPGDNAVEMLARGEVAMIQLYYDDLKSYFSPYNIDPNLLFVCPIPAGPGGKRVIHFSQNFAAAGESIGRRTEKERDAVWELIRRLGDQEAYDESIRTRVLYGQARFCNPADLDRLGFGDYARDIPPLMLQMYEDISNGNILIHTEPFVGNWITMDGALRNNVLTPVLVDSGEKFDYVRALKRTQDEANHGVMFKRPRHELAQYRPIAYVIFLVVALFVLVLVILIVRANIGKSDVLSSRAGAYTRWVPWLMLFPALGSIALWGYYPLAKGLVMAFQDYHIIGKSPFVGLDNLIEVYLNPDFYLYIIKTCKFVLLNFLLAFFTPIILALFLAEVPRGKVFFRTLFFIPQMTSPLVVALLWKLIYDPTEKGLLNRLLTYIGIGPHDWLGNANTAMAATILPSVWAASGIASLIYLAAMKSIPDDIYEAADLDSAGILAKVRWIVWPSILPLVIINFLGTTIGTFQSMGNIFLMTFGGPEKETMVLPLAIWIEAYNNLRFSTASAMAWSMGSALIGLSYLQIRLLRQVEFRRAEV